MIKSMSVFELFFTSSIMLYPVYTDKQDVIGFIKIVIKITFYFENNQGLA